MSCVCRLLCSGIRDIVIYLHGVVVIVVVVVVVDISYLRIRLFKMHVQGAAS
jgi:hypothetical protein